MVLFGKRRSNVGAAKVGVLALVFLLAACQPGAFQNENEVFTKVRKNDVFGLNEFLNAGGDANLVNPDGDSLLYVASGAKGGMAVVQVLLLAGADANQVSRQKRTALHTAAAWCNQNIVEALLAAGGDASALNGEGKSPVDVVCAQPYERRDEVMALFDNASQ